jgi:hypothetical protein
MIGRTFHRLAPAVPASVVLAGLNVAYRVGGKNECKNGGWQTFTRPTFRNQGQCVSFMER